MINVGLGTLVGIGLIVLAIAAVALYFLVISR